VKLAWRHYRFPAGLGIARGYLSAAFNLYDALRRRVGPALRDAGAAGSDPRAHLHFCPPHWFAPVPGKINVLFTMWEAPVIPPALLDPISRADRLVVPSTYCAEVWRAHGLEAQVVPLGVHESFLSTDYSRRTIAMAAGTGPRRRFLWVGSPIERKGWDRLAPAWARAFEGAVDPPQLYVKTIATDPADRIVRGMNGQDHVLVDGRDLEPADMLALYASADVFVSTSYGEGFGLPALEAMAAGCLVVSPLTGGHADFLDDSHGIVVPTRDVVSIRYGDAAYRLEVASIADLADSLRTARAGFGSPDLEARRLMGVHRARSMTWGASAEGLLRAIEAAAGQDVPRGTFPGAEPTEALGAPRDAQNGPAGIHPWHPAGAHASEAPGGPAGQPN